jgi:hypothetical protein
MTGMKAERIIPANQSVMNSEHIRSQGYGGGWIRCIWAFIAVVLGMAAAPGLGMSSVIHSNYRVGVQDAKTATDADFSSAIAAMANSDPNDAAAIEKSEKKALGILDGVILSTLNANGRPDLDSLNARLANLGTHDHDFGEGYRVARLSSKPAVYALVADFGLGAPSAVRLYAEQGSPTKYGMAGEIDRFTQKDLFDDSLDLVELPLPENISGALFVTVAGRTDQLKTGVFTAWRFDGKQLEQLWSTDLISHSKYEISADSFALTYCHDPVDQDSKTCQSMVREKYAYSASDGKWRQVSSEPVPNGKQ